MAIWDIYIDVVNGLTVQSSVNSASKPLPPLIQGDTQTWRVRLLRPTGAQIGSPFSVIDTSGDLQIAIGTRVGNSSTYYTQQFTWAKGGTPADPYWEAQMPLNTAAITTLLGTSMTATAYLEVKLFEGGLPTTVFDSAVTLYAAVIKDAGVPTVPPGLTACSVEYANATFLQRRMRGAIIIESEDGLRAAALWVGNDGQTHFDPLPA